MVIVFALVMIALSLVAVGFWIATEYIEYLDRKRYGIYKQYTSKIQKYQPEQNSPEEPED